MNDLPWLACHGVDDWRAAAADALQADAAMRAVGEVVAGRCVLCGTDSTFIDGRLPERAREGILCVRCGCNARQRAAAAVLLRSLQDPRTARVHATECASRFFVALHRRVGSLSGSEFTRSPWTRLRLTAWLWRQGRFIAPVRREDVTALTLATASLDAMVSLDVLEHVPDHRRALGEFARVVRPGGWLVLTVPFHEGQAHSERVAWIGADGAIGSVGEPEYHGDPLSGGVLCFHHFGWDLLHALREAGFREAAAVRVWDPAGAVPLGQWVLRARR